MAKFTEALRSKFIETLTSRHGTHVSRKQILAIMHELATPVPNWLLNSSAKVGRGDYDLSLLTASPAAPAKQVVAEQVDMSTVAILKPKKMQIAEDSPIPVKDPTYVPFGFYSDMKTIISSNKFYPTFISGLSGNGKTTMVEQVCASLGREVYRVNISIETDEDSLIGGQTLIDGNVVFREGPALTAMRRGGILLLDEIDRGSNKLMCLQAILEGKPYYNKKTGEVVHSNPGFNVIATANTKGRGSDDGKFNAAQLLDEAFLERFAITVEQEYPENKVERKIVMNNMKLNGVEDKEFAEKLVNWADIIRKTFIEGGIDELISTRRLVRIVEAYSMFKDRMKAIDLCVSRFDKETKDAFLELYIKMEEPPKEEAPAEEINQPVQETGNTI